MAATTRETVPTVIDSDGVRPSGAPPTADLAPVLAHLTGTP
jgi:hypothetical protein